MHTTSRITLGAIAVPVGVAVAADDPHAQPLAATLCDGLAGDELVRTELFFGLSRLLHAGDEVDGKEIEEIRGDYIDRFDQQSVLRTDERSCVSF